MSVIVRRGSRVVVNTPRKLLTKKLTVVTLLDVRPKNPARDGVKARRRHSAHY
jgi:hypothetical protein